MRKFRVAFYGINHDHCAAKVYEIKKMPDMFEIVGIVCENDEVYQKRVPHDQAYVGMKFITEEELFSMDDIDFVCVETHTHSLVPFGQKCIDKGWHIHLDKPAGVNLEAYKYLLDCAEKKNLIVQMGYMYRYNNAILYAFDKVREGFIGDIFSIDTSMSTGLYVDFKETLISYNIKAPAMYIYGCHLIDLIISLWGEPLKVHPFNKNTNVDGLNFEDNSFAVLEYPNGVATVRINCSEVNGWERREFTVCGTEGTISIKPIEAPTKLVQCRKEDAKAWTSCATEVKFPQQNGRYTDQFIHLAKMIRKEAENPYSYHHDYLVHKYTLIACGYEFDEE